jgi:hypothetical protein
MCRPDDDADDADDSNCPNYPDYPDDADDADDPNYPDDGRADVRQGYTGTTSLDIQGPG